MYAQRHTLRSSTAIRRWLHVKERIKKTILNRLLLILALSFVYGPATAGYAQEKKMVNSFFFPPSCAASPV